MGNMLPCLVVQQGTAGALPAMNPKRRLISLKLLMKAIHKVKKRPAGPGKAAEIDSKSTSSASSAVDDDGKGGGEALEAAARSSTNNPKGAVLRSRLHGQRSGAGLGNKKGKGVVRVKVVLTKEEAARLLSLSVGGGQKHTTAAQIVAEMRKMEARRRVAAGAAWRPALASIPEESS